jgi:hypothetical protein
MSWIIVSKSSGGDRFYPIHSIRKKLRCPKIGYKQAQNKPMAFWKDKNVIFHMVWAQEHPFVWRKFYKQIAENAKSFWIEFDADYHFNNLKGMDIASWGGPLFIYNEIAKVSPRLIWEFPMSYNPFLLDVERLKLCVYERRWEKPVKPNRPIDFLAFLDSTSRNTVLTLRLLEAFTEEGFNVKCIFLNKKFHRFYKDKLNFPIIKNSKFTVNAEKVFHKQLLESKVFLDLSDRLTMGRNIYESLFYGAIPVASKSYGATNVIAPQYGIDPYNIDIADIYAKALTATESWSAGTVQQLRQEAFKRGSIGKFIQQLKERT